MACLSDKACYRADYSQGLDRAVTRAAAPKHVTSSISTASVPLTAEAPVPHEVPGAGPTDSSSFVSSSCWIRLSMSVLPMAFPALQHPVPPLGPRRGASEARAASGPSLPPLAGKPNLLLRLQAGSSAACRLQGIGNEPGVGGVPGAIHGAQVLGGELDCAVAAG